MIVTLIINTTRNIQILHGVRVWMMMTTYQISPPELFDFSKPENWQRFRQASNLSAQTDKSQVNTMIYTMGNDADDILCSFHLTEEQKKNYDTVKEKFESQKTEHNF